MTDANVNLLLSGLNRKGFVAAICNFIFQHSGNSVHADHPIFKTMKIFFMRIKEKRGGFTLPHGVKTVKYE